MSPLMVSIKSQGLSPNTDECGTKTHTKFIIKPVVRLSLEAVAHQQHIFNTHYLLAVLILSLFLLGTYHKELCCSTSPYLQVEIQPPIPSHLYLSHLCTLLALHTLYCCVPWDADNCLQVWILPSFFLCWFHLTFYSFYSFASGQKHWLTFFPIQRTSMS